MLNPSPARGHVSIARGPVFAKIASRHIFLLDILRENVVSFVTVLAVDAAIHTRRTVFEVSFAQRWLTQVVDFR